jgi:hypothetical protein
MIFSEEVIQALAAAPPAVRFRRLRIVCGALVLGVAALNAAVFLLPRMQRGQPASLPNVLVTTLLVTGVVLLVAAPAVMRAIYKRADAEGFEGDRRRALVAYATSTLVAFSLRAAAAMLGFVLTVATANPWWSWGLGGAAAIAMLLGWPRRKDVDR